MAGKRVAHAIRVSTEEQAKGYSTKDQRRQLAEHSERAGDEVVEVIVEEGDSGANPFRYAVTRIMALAEAGAVDEVWSTRRDRLFRRRLYRLQLEEDLRDYGVTLRSLDDTGNRFVDAIKDEYAEEEREVMRERTRAGRQERARQGEVVAGIAPYGFRFTPDKKNFEVEESEAAVIRRIFDAVALGTSISGLANALTEEGVPTPRGDRRARGSGDGKTWSRAVLRQIVLSDCYYPRTAADRAALVEAGNLDPAVPTPEPFAIWWFNRETVETRYKDGGKTRRFRENPRSAWIAVPIPDPGVGRETVVAARRLIADNRAPSNAGRRFWELSGGVLYCACGRRMATHTANRKGGRDYYYVCGKRRSNRGTCEHLRYHPAGETEERVRSLVRGILSRPEEVRRRVEEYVAAERKRLGGVPREIAGWETRLSTAERRRSRLLDLAADGTITRDDLSAKLSEMDTERERAREEIARLRSANKEIERLSELPGMVEDFVRDLPYLLDTRRTIREIELIGPKPAPGDPLSGIHEVSGENIYVRGRSAEEIGRLEREAEDERAARYRRMYDDLGLRVTAHKDGTLEATWRFGKAVLRKQSDTAPIGTRQSTSTPRSIRWSRASSRTRTGSGATWTRWSWSLLARG